MDDQWQGERRRLTRKQNAQPGFGTLFRVGVAALVDKSVRVGLVRKKRARGVRVRRDLLLMQRCLFDVVELEVDEYDTDETGDGDNVKRVGDVSRHFNPPHP